MGEYYRLADILQGIGGFLARTVARSTHVDRVSAVQYRFSRYVLIGSRCKKF
jgi:hypothetical protein